MPPLERALEDHRTSRLEQTDLVTGVVGSGEDVYASSTSSPGASLANAYAAVSCSANSSGVCVGSKNLVWNNLTTANISRLHYLAIACHELGHTVGLDHLVEDSSNGEFLPPEQSCLRPGNPTNVYWLSVRENAFINSRY